MSFPIQGPHGILILSREVDLVPDEDEGGFYLARTMPYSRSKLFPTKSAAIKAWSEGSFRWRKF